MTSQFQSFATRSMRWETLEVGSKLRAILHAKYRAGRSRWRGGCREYDFRNEQLFPLASIAPLDCQRRDPKQASGGARRRSRPRAGLFRSRGRHHLVMVGGIIPLRRATSSRYDERLGQESAVAEAVGHVGRYSRVHCCERSAIKDEG